MSHGRIVTLDDGRTVHVGGRRRPKEPAAIRLELGGKYKLDVSSWPTSPQSHYSDADAAQPILRDVLGNDTLGCCTIADRLHRQALRLAAAGGTNLYHPSTSDVLALYSRCGGYVPGQPSTDNGCDETTVLGDAQTAGTPSGPQGQIDKSSGWAAIAVPDAGAGTVALVRAVTDAFAGASFCTALAPSWIAAMQAGDGFVLDTPSDQPDPDDGHCMTIGDQGPDGLVLWSWATRGTLTFAGLAAACRSPLGSGALYIELDADLIAAATKKAPDLLDWWALLMDFRALPSGVMTPVAP